MVKQKNPTTGQTAGIVALVAAGGVGLWALLKDKDGGQADVGLIRKVGTPDIYIEETGSNTVAHINETIKVDFGWRNDSDIDTSASFQCQLRRHSGGSWGSKGSWVKSGPVEPGKTILASVTNQIPSNWDDGDNIDVKVRVKTTEEADFYEKAEVFEVGEVGSVIFIPTAVEISNADLDTLDIYTINIQAAYDAGNITLQEKMELQSLINQRRGALKLLLKEVIELPSVTDIENAPSIAELDRLWALVEYAYDNYPNTIPDVNDLEYAIFEQYFSARRAELNLPPEMFGLEIQVLAVNGVLGTGKVTVSPPGEMVLYTIYYAPGTPVTVVLTPVTGYTFKHWIKNGVIISTSRSFVVTMNGDTIMQAVLEKTTEPPPAAVTITLTTSVPTGGGAIYISPGKSSYAGGELIWCTALKNAGYSFAYWDIGGVQFYDSQVQIELPSYVSTNVAIKAYFYKTIVAPVTASLVVTVLGIYNIPLASSYIYINDQYKGATNASGQLTIANAGNVGAVVTVQALWNSGGNTWGAEKTLTLQSSNSLTINL